MHRSFGQRNLDPRVTDEDGIELALELARAALAAGEPPFGAVVVDGNDRVIARTMDSVNGNRDMTRHAELEAVRTACAIAGPDLTGCTLFTTCEPCPMCFTAAWLARVTRIAWGCSMADVATVMGSAQRELAVPASQMNEFGGGQIALRAGVRDAECLALFTPAS
jgi:tRNA(adenine34) deaminase